MENDLLQIRPGPVHILLKTLVQIVNMVHSFVTVGRALGHVTQLIMAEFHVAASFPGSR